MIRYRSLVIFVCGLCAGVVFSQNNEPLYRKEANLKKFLLTDYDRTVPPNPDNNTSTEVDFGLGLVDIESLDESSEILTTHVWIRLFWNDQRLKFNPAEHGGLSSVAIPYDLVWRPDTVPYSLSQDEFKYSTDYQALVFSDGSVLFVPHTRLQTRCALDFTKYPFDQQQCSLKFGSWVYNGNIVHLKSHSPGIDTNDYLQNSKWQLVNTTYSVNSYYYPCCVEEYQTFSANLTVRRHGAMLANMYLGPAVAIGLSIPVIFLLPEYSLYKLVLGGTLLISQLQVFSMLVQSLPTSHSIVPAIALYELANVVLLLLAIACSSVVIYCSYRAQRGRFGVPYVIDKFFLGICGRLFCARKEDYITENPDVESPSEQNISASSDDTAGIIKEYTRLVAPAEWRQLAVILDRLFFALFTVITIFIMAVMVRYSF